MSPLARTGRPGDLAELEVRVATGALRGVAERGVRAWRGIPYAAAPVGALRFREHRTVPESKPHRNPVQHCPNWLVGLPRPSKHL